MQNNINYERVGIRLANQLATAMYQNAVLETVVETMKEAHSEPPAPTTKDSNDA